MRSTQVIVRMRRIMCSGDYGEEKPERRMIGWMRYCMIWRNRTRELVSLSNGCCLKGMD